MDIQMPGLNGLDTLDQIKQENPSLPVLMHSSQDCAEYIKRSMRSDAAGYIVKGSGHNGLIDAVRKALNGGHVWTQSQRQRSEQLLER